MGESSCRIVDPTERKMLRDALSQLARNFMLSPIDEADIVRKFTSLKMRNPSMFGESVTRLIRAIDEINDIVTELNVMLSESDRYHSLT